MSSKLTLLLVGSDTELYGRIVQTLEDAPWEAIVEQVPDLGAMCSALEANRDTFDLVLCHHELVDDCVRKTREALAASDTHLPLLIIADTYDGQAAVESIEAGAYDWIIAHHIEQRLLPAVARAMKHAQQRRESGRFAAALADSRQRYRDLTETLPQGIYELDRQGRFTFVNERALELFGYTREDLDRRPHVATILSEEDREQAMQRIERILSGEASEGGGEYAIVSSDGTLIPVLVHSSPITESGEVVGLRGVVTDLRESRETEQLLHRSEERYRRLVETMGDGLLTIDRDGVITYANQALADMLHAPLERIVGTHASALVDEENAAILENEIERRFSEGLPGVYELGAETETGEELTLLVTATPLRDDKGRVTASLAVITDITQQRRVQQQLRRIKTAVDNSSDAIGIADADREPVYLNPAFTEMFGYTVEELCEAGGPRANFADQEEYADVFEQIEQTGTFIGEFEGIHASGRTFPVMGRVDRVQDARGEPTGVVAVFSDITARREHEQRQRLINARLSLINRLNQMLNGGDSIDEIIATGADRLREILDAHHVHIFMRQPADNGEHLVMRYSNMPREAAHRVFDDLEEAQEIVLPLRTDVQAWQLYETGEPVEIRAAELNETVRDIERWAYPSPRYRGMRIVEELGIRYLCLMPLTHGGEPKGHVTVSRSDDTPLSEAEMALLESFAQQMAVILDKARAEQQLSRLNQLLEAIIENAAAWFSVVDEDQELIIWNHAAAQISGYSHDEIRSARHLMQLLYPDPQERQTAYEYVDAAFAGEDIGEIETTIVRADGSERRMAWHIRRFETAGRGVGLVVVGRDITESHELYKQLQRVQRMDAVGTLAGGIAHDFNNVLTAIVGHADLLASEAEENGRVRWHADQISENARRASRLTRQLLAFSRKQPSRPKVVDLNRLIRDMEEMFRRVIPEDIQLRLDLTTDLGYAEIDPSQVEQILMNLVLNARDAMPDGGDLQITTTNTTLNRDSISELFDASPGEYVTLQVHDTGVGMDEETESHIFEPFFTTKQNDGGTGLGLSTVYGLVRQSQGAINVYSEVGNGTLFRIYLPRVDEAEKAVSADEQAERTSLEGDETILVVEDADNLRDLIGTILQTFGYTVHTAPRGDKALVLEERYRGEIDLVVSDVVMPEMSGTELAERLLEISPELKVLFISGYPTERAISAEHTDGRYSFLQKPFSAIELGQKIREILDKG